MSASPSPAPDDGPHLPTAVPMPPQLEHHEGGVHMLAHPGAPVERERKRVRLACSNCHRGKIKCDGERPCDRCIKKGLAPEDCIDFQRKRTACTSCRAVKMKCDGNRPCKRCTKKGKGDECTDIEPPGMRRPRPDHRLKHEAHDPNVDDGHRPPVPYDYEGAAAAAAGYYYAPPWAYPVPGGPWQPYGPHAHVYPPPYPQPGQEDEAARAQYNSSLRSSYPEMQAAGEGAIDPALDPEILRQSAAQQQPEGWREILANNNAARAANGGPYYAEGHQQEAEEGGDEGEHDGEDGEEGDGEAGEGDDA